jgi:hypothetical protein
LFFKYAVYLSLCRFAFITKKTAEEAEETAKLLNNMVVAKNVHHTYRIEQIEKALETIDNYEPAPSIPFEPKPDLYNWMLDPYSKNQFLVFRSEICQVFYFDPIRGTESLLELV